MSVHCITHSRSTQKLISHLVARTMLCVLVDWLAALSCMLVYPQTKCIAAQAARKKKMAAVVTSRGPVCITSPDDLWRGSILYFRKQMARHVHSDSAMLPGEIRGR